MYIYNIEHESLFDTITSAFKNHFNVIFIQGEAPWSLSKVSFLSKTETRLYTTDSQLVSSALPDSTLDEYMIVTEGGGGGGAGAAIMFRVTLQDGGPLGIQIQEKVKLKPGFHV